MARMYGTKWFTLRRDFIDWFGSGIEPGTIVTNCCRRSIGLERLRTVAHVPTNSLIPDALYAAVDRACVRNRFLPVRNILLGPVSVRILQPTMHAQRYAAMRQANGLSIAKPTAIFETKGP